MSDPTDQNILAVSVGYNQHGTQGKLYRQKMVLHLCTQMKGHYVEEFRNYRFF